MSASPSSAGTSPIVACPVRPGRVGETGGGPFGFAPSPPPPSIQAGPPPRPATQGGRGTGGVPFELPDSPAPISIELDRAHGLTLEWDDGVKATFELEELRVNCPCAECRGLREQDRPVWPKPSSPRPLAANGAELV